MPDSRIAENQAAPTPVAETPLEGTKCVIVIDQDLPLGVIANTAAVLSLSLGRALPQMIGEDLRDNQGQPRRGITTLPLPILKSTGDKLRTLREAVKAHEPDLTVIDLISATRHTATYRDYAEELENTPVETLEYQGVALCGAKKLVNKFTGNLGLLR